jgi:hypothetical protein
MENEDLEFVENQYLGFNLFSLTTRLIVALACITAFFTSASSLNDNTSNLFLILGISILIISILFFFVLHIKTLIIEHWLIISGYFNARIIKLNLKDIVSCEKVQYSKLLLNRPIYNLHVRGKIKFYTHGKYALKLIDKHGLIYLIGTQKSDKLQKIINNKIKL